MEKNKNLSSTSLKRDLEEEADSEDTNRIKQTKVEKDSKPKMCDAKVRVPLQGNAWCCDGGAITHKGLSKWVSHDAVCKTYVYIAQPGNLQVGIIMNPKGSSTLSVTIDGQSQLLTAESNHEKEFNVGEWSNVSQGYVAIQIQGVEKSSKKFGTVSALVLSGSAICDSTTFVKNNEDNFYYWGRRGPSVHLKFTIPKKDIEWFYNEVTVPKSNDVIGSYFMANGFSQGYFGIQVNSATERRVLFSVWSPFATDDPKSIPEEDRIKVVKKGENVYTGEFGNEGSGGQSYLVYPWEADTTYKFLIRAEPSKSTNSTTFTAYFGSTKDSKWILIASFTRPKVATYLKGLHSFLENFIPNSGDSQRMAYYDNQWICTKSNDWIELTEIQLTADETARKNFRRDFAGGVADDKFYLKNCGFFCENTKLDSTFKRTPKKVKPIIDFGSLP